ncbi:MAG: cation diffusion facilitator family transporter [Candidatus Heimdallarchaeota archaeon]|nr:cation diffusion facilitator family transporter [Candidatus Heimdallarchaeota archaeon]
MSEDKNPKKRFGMEETVWVAFTSVIAAIFLTTIKLVVGIMSGSIGILSEALHSALDLIAAGITFFAVKSSKKPADKEYNYGYGKIESLSALIETLLLLITVVWIFYEAVRRIVTNELEIETNVWSFAVMVLAIGIDYGRSRALYKAAEKYDSQALKADALHFSTDILSSSMVIIGLIFTEFGFELGDPLGAIGVGIIVLYLTFNLGKETVYSLLDKAPEEMQEKMQKELEHIEGIKSISTLRIRKSGAEYFVDLVCTLKANLTIVQSQQVVGTIRYRLSKLVEAPVSVLVNTQPDRELNTLQDKINELKNKYTNIREIHHLNIFNIDQKITMTMHVELSGQKSYFDAHELISKFEKDVMAIEPQITEIYTHIEPYRENRITQFNEEKITKRIHDIIAKIPLLENAHNIKFHPIVDGLHNLSLHCKANPSSSLEDIHKATVVFEDEIREEIPCFVEVTIHSEPN